MSKKDLSIHDFCQKLYQYAKDNFEQIENHKAVRLPSNVLKERVSDVKSNCIFFAQILKVNEIKHKIHFAKFPGLHRYSYAYIIAFDEGNQPIHLHTDLDIEFNSDECFKFPDTSESPLKSQIPPVV